MIRFDSKEEALEYCFSQIKQAKIGAKDYIILKQYMYRHRKGETLKDTAINSLFDYFNVESHCFYTVEDSENGLD